MGELFQLSVILHFPPEVYLRRGVGELAPLLVRALHESEISALQFLRGGLARVTVRSSAYREELLSSDFMFEDTPIPVTPADRPTISVYLRDLPVEISDDSVRSALESFGDVFSVRSTVYKDFPSIRNGTRVLLMSVKQPIPSSLNVLGFTCRTWYPGQPAFCSICRQSGHLPRACPLSGLCRRCEQPGHVARECPRARGSSQSSSVPVCEVPPDPVPSSDVPVPASDVPVPAPVSTMSPVPASIPVSTSASTPVTIPSTSVLSVLTSPVSSPTVQLPASSVTNFQVPVFPVSADVPLEEGEIVMPSDLSEADASSSKPVRPSTVPRVTPANDYKKLVRLVLPKVKPGSVSSTVKKLCLSLVKTHKLNVSDDECARIAASICSKS